MSESTSASSAEEMERGLRVLADAPYAYVAMVDTDRPYVVPMNFACDLPAGRLYLHTGPGRKSAALTRNPRVCVVVAVDTSFDQGSTPCSDGFAFRSVMVEGGATLMEDSTERETALRAIVGKYDPGAAGEPFDADVLAQTLVYTVDMETVSYRELPRSAG